MQRSGKAIRTASVAAGLVLCVCTASGQDRERQDTVMVAPSPVQNASRGVLVDRLGGQSATSAATAPSRSTVPLADRFLVQDSAMRAYGDLHVSVYRTQDESMSFALVHSIEPATVAPLAVGRGGWEDGSRTAFWTGAFAVVIDGGSTSTRAGLATAILPRIAGSHAPAPLIAHLPKQGRLAGTERYAPALGILQRERSDLREDIFQFEAGGAEAALADYEQTNVEPFHVLLVEYQTPQLAADAERRLAAYYESLAPEIQQRTLIRREGNYLVEATGVVDEPSGRRVVDSVDYAYTIRWLKDPFDVSKRDFAEEARKTALVIMNSFIFVGMCFVIALFGGLVVGASIFRMRRRAAANVFSDAGGMTRLELGSRRLPAGSSSHFLPAADES